MQRRAQDDVIQGRGDAMATPAGQKPDPNRPIGAAKDFAGEVIGNESSTSRGRYVTSYYDDPARASRVYDHLRTRDYTADDLDVVMSDDTRRTHFTDTEAGTKAAEGMGVGGAIGGGIGAALAAAFAVGTAVVVPGLGLVVAGPIAAALAGAGAGAATGGLIGAMVGAGIPEERARVYEQGVRDGGVVIGARARDDQQAAQLERDFTEHGGSHILGLR
jgi:hypothetical protein